MLVLKETKKHVYSEGKGFRNFFMMRMKFYTTIQFYLICTENVTVV